MTKASHLNESAATYEKFLSKLESTQTEISNHLRSSLDSHGNTLGEAHGADVHKMIEASHRAMSQIAHGHELATSNDVSENDWKNFRHDLRAAIGAITGYAELVFEDLTDEGVSDLELMRLLSTIRELSSEQMPFIDKLRSDDGASYISPNGGLFEEAAEDEKGKAEDLSALIIGNILVVDDDEHKRSILCRRLKKNGHRVTMAENGHRALEILERSSFDLILLDIIMPGITGIDVLKSLQQQEKYNNVPILVISSLNDVESVVECIKLGAEDYLPMPFNPVLLMARVNSCLHKKILRDRDTENINELDRMRLQLEAALESIEDGFAVFNLFDEMTMSNRKFQNLYPSAQTIEHPDYSYREFLESNYKDGRYKIDQRRKNDKVESFDDWIELRMSRHQFAKEPYMELLDDGRWIEITENRTPDGGTVSIHKDVTASKEGEDRLKFLAHHDPLTGLANRALFEQSLQNAYEDAISKKVNFGIMYLDLDGFKKVNDTLGHEFGDFLLVQVSEKLTANVRDDDIVARLGGDEFAILMSDIEGIDAAKKLADRILKAVGNHVEREDKKADFGVSIGISLFPIDGHSVEEILSKADQAMYAAKKAGKGVFKTAAEI